MVVGTSPIEGLSVSAGKPIVLEFEHPEATKSKQEITLPRGQLFDQIFNLQKKPSRLTVRTTPSDSEISVDEKSVSEGTSISLPPGKHKVQVKRKGFADLETSVDLKGGESRVLDLRLSKYTEREKELMSPSWSLGFSPLTYSSPMLEKPDLSLYQATFDLEYFLHWILGIHFRYAFGMGYRTYSDGNLSATSHTGMIGVPIHFAWFRLFRNDSLFLEPRISLTRMKLETRSDSTLNVHSSSVGIQRKGVDLGFRTWKWPTSDSDVVSGMILRFGMDLNDSASGSFRGRKSRSGGIEWRWGF